MEILRFEVKPNADGSIPVMPGYTYEMTAWFTPAGGHGGCGPTHRLVPLAPFVPNEAEKPGP